MLVSDEFLIWACGLIIQMNLISPLLTSLSLIIVENPEFLGLKFTGDILRSEVTWSENEICTSDRLFLSFKVMDATEVALKCKHDSKWPRKKTMVTQDHSNIQYPVNMYLKYKTRKKNWKCIMHNKSRDVNRDVPVYKSHACPRQHKIFRK